MKSVIEEIYYNVEGNFKEDKGIGKRTKSMVNFTINFLKI